MGQTKKIKSHYILNNYSAEMVSVILASSYSKDAFSRVHVPGKFVFFNSYFNIIKMGWHLMIERWWLVESVYQRDLLSDQNNNPLTLHIICILIYLLHIHITVGHYCTATARNCNIQKVLLQSEFRNHSQLSSRLPGFVFAHDTKTEKCTTVIT